MNCYIWMCIFAVVAVQCTTVSLADALTISPKIDEPNLNNSTSTPNCTKARFFCKSCSELMMRIETEYGWTEQLIETCSGSYSCNNNECRSGKNIECDGTMDIPFKCHVPGTFPDPFDCQAYHLCVLTTEQQGDDIVEVVKDFKHICPNEGDQKYRYDAKSMYCKYRIDNKCSELPVPVCKKSGESKALIENESIYYICERIGNVLYPNLYSCPYGRIFNNCDKRCEPEFDYTTSSEAPSTIPSSTSPASTSTPSAKWLSRKFN